MTDLRALAKAATKGPWEYLGPTSGQPDNEGILHPFVIGPNGENPICTMGGDWRDEQADAAFIAACSPDAILALLDRLDGVERERDELMGLLNARPEAVKAFIERVRGLHSPEANESAQSRPSLDGTEGVE